MLKRKTGLKPGKPLARSEKPMRKASKGLCAKKRAQRRAYAQAADAEQCWCSACGKAGPTDHSHILSQGNHDAHRNDERNWLKLCRPCHDLIEHNKAGFAARFPQVYADMVRRMQEVDPAAARFFLSKNPAPAGLGTTRREGPPFGPAA